MRGAFLVLMASAWMFQAHAEAPETCEAIRFKKNSDGKIEAFRPDAPYKRIWIDESRISLPMQVEDNHAGRFIVHVEGEVFEVRKRHVVFASKAPCNPTPPCQLANSVATTYGGMGSDRCAN